MNRFKVHKEVETDQFVIVDTLDNSVLVRYAERIKAEDVCLLLNQRAEESTN
jgi:hypothetical protein